ncbi:MAG: hypothetical protein ABII82_05840 [Verrucomicrobiota bacterium]
MRSRFSSSVGIPRVRKQAGFALLITITLVAFLVLLIVSFASLTRVETQVAGNSQKLSTARQNALLALNVALGQLQKYAGPDQRVTTSADMLAMQDETGAAAPASIQAGLPRLAVSNGARHWTGVWGNSQAAISYELTPAAINGRGVSPTLLNWLVSGNESVDYIFNGTAGGVTAGTGAASPAFAPDGAVAQLTGASATSDDITIQDVNGQARPAVLLVGQNTVGAAPSAQAGHVVAPLVDITAAPGSIPGQGSAATPTIGRYAWWVGDEGIKARVNLQNGYQATGDPVDHIDSFLTSQRAAVEFVDRDHSGNAVGDDFDFTAPEVRRILSPAQLTLAATGADAQDHLKTASQTRFHDLTTQSRGVLSDAYAGGLKKDLSADIANPSAAATASPSATNYRPADDTPIFVPQGGDALLPTWGHLRSWARTSGNSVAATVPTDTDAGISPMILYASLGFDVYVDENDAVRFTFFPVVALSNPYPVTLTGNYDLGFKFPQRSRFEINVRQTPASGPPTTTTTLGRFWLGDLNFTFGTATIPPTTASYIPFSIDTGGGIPPGESRVYRLDPALSGTDYTLGTAMRLTLANAAPPIGLTNHLRHPTAVPIPLTIDPNPELMCYPQLIGPSVPALAIDPTTVTLAPPGGLNTPGVGHYQSYSMQLDTNQLSSTATPDGHMPIGLYRYRINDLKWRTDGLEARAAFRMIVPMEANGRFSSSYLLGTPPRDVAWLRQGNPRAPEGRMTSDDRKADGTPNPGTPISGALLLVEQALIDADAFAPSDIALMPFTNGYAVNASGDMSASATNTNYATLFDVLPSPDSLLSLGQFQHVPFSRYVFYPAYPFANAMADVRIDRTDTYTAGIGPGASPVYDLSWHLNRALWDRYFISSVPAGLTQADIDEDRPLPNARMTYHRRDNDPIPLDSVSHGGGTGQAYDQAASRLMVKGAFNINSTSEQAWRAILGGTAGIPDDTAYSDSSDNVDEIVPFARFSRNLARTASGPYPALATTMLSDTTNGTFLKTLYHGNRGLWLGDSRTGTANPSASAVINELASRIVREIRRSGPFLSVADFVNRPVVADAAGIKGPLQAALDSMRLTEAQANPSTTWFQHARAVRLNTPHLTNTEYTSRYPSAWHALERREHYAGGASDEWGSSAQPPPPFLLPYAFAPKYLSQADLLSTLGPVLSARSDTFTIRSYGEALNPATGDVEGKAWCEAVVQRVPDYVDPDLNQPEASPTGDNITFGRRIKIISFRWLAPSDI